MMGVSFGKPDLQDLPAKRTPVGRAFPFLRIKRLAYPTLPRLPNSAHSPQRTVRRLAAPCTPAGTGNRTRSRRPKQKGRPKWTAVLHQTALSGNHLSRNPQNHDRRNRPLTPYHLAMTTPIRVLLVDDHPAILAGLRVILGHTPDVEIVGEATALPEAATLIEAARPDVIVLDYELGNDAGPALLVTLATAETRPATLLLSAHDNPAYLYEAYRLGAAGYFLKGVALDVVLEGVRQAARGNLLWTPVQLARIDAWKAQVRFKWDSLTGRERGVLHALVQGKSNREISTDLFVTERTVESHVSSILCKLGVSSRAEAAAWVRETGLYRFVF